MTDADAAPCSVGVVVVAAGSGTRLGAGMPKAFVHLAGRPLISHALDTAWRVPHLISLVVVAPDGHEDPNDPLDSLWDGVVLPPGTRVVAGGAERTDSVAAGLAALVDGVDIVLVHDAARCLTPLEVFERVVAAVAAGAAGAVPGVPVVDTIKAVDACGVITATPDRSMLRAVQTPQGFRLGVLAAAYGSGVGATDDAALVEAMGERVVVVQGHADAFKVTTVLDLAHAERLLAARPPVPPPAH
ncbi:MAG: 2-C-methyl-D-erythritol 4-phosphate cytidylyltransferase [Ornithinibacter sp.]